MVQFPTKSSNIREIKFFFNGILELLGGIFRPGGIVQKYFGVLERMVPPLGSFLGSGDFFGFFAIILRFPEIELNIRNSNSFSLTKRYCFSRYVTGFPEIGLKIRKR